jgi:hypothetical protein
MQFLKKKMFLPMSSLVMLLCQMETIRPMSDDEFTTIDGVEKQN